LEDQIKVRGAREHNLKNVDLNIPKNKLVIFTGVSGSGKSSMAMDTIYAEGQRRYVESLSSYARQFLGVMNKPEIESIEGLSPAIAIDQKTTSKNPRSTVGTVTEIYDYLRVLFARIGRVYDPKTGKEIKRQSVDEITDNVLDLITNDRDIKIKGVWALVLSPIVRGRKGEYSKLLENLQKQGYTKVRVDGLIHSLSKDINLIKTNKHTIEVVVDRIVIGKETLKNDEKLKEFKTRLFQSIETSTRLSDGLVTYSKVLDSSAEFPDSPKDMQDTVFSENFAFDESGVDFPEVEPRIFSFNTPFGACPNCSGLGNILKIDTDLIYNPVLSVLEGGIYPLGDIGEKSSWTRKRLEAVAKDEKINLSVPMKDLSEEHLNILLFGSIKGRISQRLLNNVANIKDKKGKKYKAPWVSAEGVKKTFDFRWEGIIPNLERRYAETDSDYIKNEVEKYMMKEQCPLCKGARLRQEALYVRINGLSIADVASMPIKQSFEWISNLMADPNLSKREKDIGQSISKEVSSRLNFLVSVGLTYLTLARSSSTLAGGEAQRIRLASQIGSGLSGVLYVLDEPSIGLHSVDHDRLITTLKDLKALGNTVLVVEHDAQTMLESDYIIDFGPGAGELGGQVVAQGTPDEIMQNPNSLTGKYLSGKKKINPEEFLIKEEKQTLKDIKDEIKKYGKGKVIKVIGARGHNLKNVDVEIPLSKFVCVTGVSGSGKSTLVNETLLKELRKELGLKNDSAPQENDGILGAEDVKKIIDIDQSPIGRTPRSNPATYTKAFDEIRKVFAQTKDARIRGYNQGRFSFNVKGGRCEACRGDGQIKIEMQFMPDVYVDCEVCEGKRYTEEVLDVYFKDKNIADVLEMTVTEALDFFKNHRNIERKLRTLHEVGLGYIRLGQPAPTLSGGEAQRVKLATELSKIPRGHTFYILDEPTTGLHFADLERLISILKKLVARGNTVLVIEHNLDVIKSADWVIDLGPAGGEEGGKIMFQGTVDNLLKDKDSKTAFALRELYYL